MQYDNDDDYRDSPEDWPLARIVFALISFACCCYLLLIAIASLV